MDKASAGEVEYGALMWRALRRRRWLVLVIFLAVASPVALYALLMDPRYDSTATIWVEEPDIGLFQDIGPRGRLPVLLTILGSRNLAATVVDALPRRTYDELLQKQLHTDWSAAMRNRVRRLLGRPGVVVSPREKVITELLMGRMTFNPKGSTGIVYVTATASDPAIAAEIGSAYVETLQSKTRVFTREESRAVREFLGEQAKQVGESLREAEKAQLLYQRQRGVVKIDDRVAQSLSNLHQAESQFSGALLAEDIARTRLAAIKAQLEGQAAEKKVTGSFTVPPSLKDLSERWGKAEAALAALTHRYTDAHPQVRAATDEAQRLWAPLDAALRRHLRITASPSLSPLERAPLIEHALAIAQEIEKLQVEREAYDAQVRAVRAGIGDLPQEEYEHARRRQAVENTRSLYDLLARKAEEANVMLQGEILKIRVLDPPSLPTSPSGRAPLKLLLVGLVLGFAVALALPLGLEMLDTSIKTEEEAEALLGWPVLGAIPAMDVAVHLADRARAGRALPPGAREGARRPE